MVKRYPELTLEGAVVAITGGSRGIGRATADLFAARGATVILGDLDGAPEAAAEIGGAARGFALDVTDPASFTAFVAAALETAGRIDVLVNNAGVMPLGDFLAEDESIGRTTMDVNAWGPIHGMRAVLPHMISRGSGHIVNVASMAGKLPIPGMAIYNASKFAAVGVSAAVREEYAHTGVSAHAARGNHRSRLPRRHGRGPRCSAGAAHACGALAGGRSAGTHLGEPRGARGLRARYRAAGPDPSGRHGGIHDADFVITATSVPAPAQAQRDRVAGTTSLIQRRSWVSSCDSGQ